ncbi:MAG: LamG-like jellyroll fold domain-containing protein [Burkholderiaceae bacterium]
MTIGGDTPADRNVIVGTTGISLGGFATQNVIVQGNYIGTDAGGTISMGQNVGITITSASGTVIGGGGAGQGNLISGNQTGIFLDSNVTLTEIQGNLIGVDATGSGPLGNAVDGISMRGSANLVGGTVIGEGNVIAYNGTGINLDFGLADGNAILGNSIHDNSALGIDLDGDGVTPNDAGDADTGANTLLNTPALTAAFPVGALGAQTRVIGSYSGLASSDIRIEFFASANADPSGYGEGERLIGTHTLTTDGSGNASFDLTLSGSVSPGEIVAATATRDLGPGYGASSEFSQAVGVQSLGPVHDLPGPANTNEDQAIVFSTVGGNAITVDDSTAATTTVLQVRLTSTNGTLSLAQTTGISFVQGANGSADMTIWGTEADLNSALDGAVFSPDPDFGGAANLHVETTDGGALQGSYDFEVAGLIGLDVSAGGGNDASALGSAAQATDATRGNVLQLDGDRDYLQVSGRFGDPADLSLSAWVNLSAPDASGAEVISLGGIATLRLDAGGGVEGELGTAGGLQQTSSGQFLAATGWHHVVYVVDSTNTTQTLYIDGSPVATTNWSALDYTGAFADTMIGASANPADFDHDFAGLLDDVRIYTRTLSADEISALNADVHGELGDIPIGVQAINDRPELSNLEAAALGYTENTAPIQVTATLTIGDVDSATLDSATVTISSGCVNGQDVPAFTDTANIIGTWSAAGGSLTLTGTDSVSAYEAALRTITYENTSEGPEIAPRTLRFTVHDGADPSLPVTRALTITAVNDAPILDDSGTPDFDTITEDDVGNPGHTVATLIARGAGADPISDVDAGAVEGIAVIATSPSAGHFEYSTDTGSNWFAVGTVAETSALLLADTDLIRFVPDGVTAEVAQITWRAWDRSSFVAGTKVNASSPGGSSAFSTATEQSSITVTSVNDAPVLAGIEVTALGYAENDPATAVTGTITVGDVDSSLIASALVDFSAGYVNGEDLLAFPGFGSISGVWNPAAGTLSLTGSDTLANYESALRLVSYRNLSDDPDTGTRTVRFVVSDGLDSSAPVTRDIDITALNDTPALVGLEAGALSYVEGDAPKALSGTIDIDDPDSVTMAGATITISGNYVPGEDILAFTDTGNIVGSWNPATGTMSLSGTDGVVIYRNALRSITYENTSQNPDTNPRTISFEIHDGSAGSPAVTRSISLTAVADPPVITGLEGDTLTYAEGAGAVVIEQGADAAASDADSGDFDTGSLTVTLSNGDPAEDIVSIRDQGSGSGQIGLAGAAVSYEGVTIGSVSGGSAGTPLIVSFNASATPQAVSALLQNITYENTDQIAPTLTQRTAGFVIADGDGQISATANATIDVGGVDDAPGLANIEPAPLAYTENDPPTQITSSLTVSDPDSTDLVSASVSITSNYAIGEDVLAFTDTGGITGSWNPATGTLTLSGVASQLSYQNALRSVTYANTSEAPSELLRQVSFQVDDGTSPSNSVSRGIAVSAQPDGPTIVNLAGDTAAYAEGGPAVLIDQASDATVSDPDSSHFDTGSMDVRFVAGSDPGEDQLIIRDQGSAPGQIGLAGANVTYGGVIIGSFSGGSAGVPLIISLNSNADPTAATALVRNIGYANLDTDNPTLGNRTVRFQLTDDTGTAGPITDAVVAVSGVNDAPVLSALEAIPIAYIENDPATALSTAISISDVDSVTMSGASISITTNYVNGEDLLEFSPLGNISAIWTDATGTLSLSGADTIANYEAALRAVTYRNLSDNPSSATRTVSVTINDGFDDSAALTRDIDLTAVNDAPALTAVEAAALTFTEGERPRQLPPHWSWLMLTAPRSPRPRSRSSPTMSMARTCSPSPTAARSREAGIRPPACSR